MEFRTSFRLAASPVQLTFQTPSLMLGSCFTSTMGQRLIDRKFKVVANPFGVLYNPASLAHSLTRLQSAQLFTEDECFFDGERWLSFWHHSRFAQLDRAIFLEKANAQLQTAAQHLAQTEVLWITFGTAWQFIHQETGEVVSNCHKVPAKSFQRSRMTVVEIVSLWTTVLASVWKQRPALQVIFTLSPIRHWKDGAIENQLSKATLRMAIAELCDRYAACHYFPAYEWMMDDLRDYRFYAADLLHPNELALDYIWERFKEVHLAPSACAELPALESLLSACQHRPFNPHGPAHQRFIQKTLAQIEALSQRLNLDFSAERAFLVQYLNN